VRRRARCSGVAVGKETGPVPKSDERKFEFLWGGVFRRADLGSFVALYYLARDQDDAHFVWSYAQSERLTAAGRANRDRELVLTWLCDYRARVARDEASVPEEIALDHRYAGLAMVWIEATAAQHGVSETSAVDALADWLVKESLSLLMADSPIGQVLLFEPRDFPEPPGNVAITPGSIEPRDGADVPHLRATCQKTTYRRCGKRPLNRLSPTFRSSLVATGDGQTLRIQQHRGALTGRSPPSSTWGLARLDSRSRRPRQNSLAAQSRTE
jgi:hypothetical protein